jgi:hypothetical protein
MYLLTKEHMHRNCDLNFKLQYETYDLAWESIKEEFLNNNDKYEVYKNDIYYDEELEYEYAETYLHCGDYYLILEEVEA